MGETGTVPEPASTSGISTLLAVIHRLRGPDGCPWDREQTLATLRPFLLEECYELLDAIDGGDADHHAEELGDVLLQVLLQAQIRAEQGDFTFDDVATRLADKLVHRHPHVFGDRTVSGSDEVVRNWEALKADEKQERRSVLDGVPRHMPSLQRSQRIQSRAARVGFDWDEVDDVMAKIEEELGEIREAMAEGDDAHVEEEVGDLLFAVVNLSRFLKINAELALDRTVAKFITRFRSVEAGLAARGRSVQDATLAEMDALWDEAKREEGSGEC